MDDADALSWRPRLRDSLLVERDGDDLQFISTADRRVKRFTASPLALRLIPLLDGRRTVAELIEQLGADSEEAVRELCEALVALREERLLSRTADPLVGPTGLPSAQLPRYERQIRLFQELCDSDQLDYPSGLTAQDRLAEATVLVCGAGGLGSVVTSALAAAGVGELVLCDDDVVEESNLTRQLMYSLDDLGRSKAEALASRLALINPHSRVRPERLRVRRAADLRGLARTADLVICCADQPSVAEMAGIVTEACWPDTAHIIGGSYSYHVGMLGLLVVPGVTACWHCLLAEVGQEHGRDRAAPFVAKKQNGGILGAQSGIIGNMIAWEAVRYLIGMPTALSDRWLELDYGPMAFSERRLRRRPDCPRCG